MRRLLLAVVAAFVLAAACGDDANEAAGPASSLCAEIERRGSEFLDLPDDEAMDLLLEVAGDGPPAQVAEPLRVLDDDSSTRGEIERAMEEVGRWVQVECGGPEGGEVRLVPSTVPDGLVLCAALDSPAADFADDDHLGRCQPRGPMVGTHGGDPHERRSRPPSARQRRARHCAW